MIKILGYDGIATAELTVGEVVPWLTQAGARIWVHVVEPTPAEEKQLQEAFSLPLLTMDKGPIAAAFLHTTPRLIMGYFPLEAEETLTFYLGQQFIITRCREAFLPLDGLWHTYQQDLSRWPYGLDYLLYQLCCTGMALPFAATLQTYSLLSTIPHSSVVSLSPHSHQLATWQYHLQQWQKLVQHLATTKHELLDINTQFHFHSLQDHIQAKIDKITLWQQWLTIKRHDQQEQREQRTQQLLSRLFWLGVLINVLLLLILLGAWF